MFVAIFIPKQIYNVINSFSSPQGDFTRTGERRFTGVMKDGYNSANRFVDSLFKGR